MTTPDTSPLRDDEWEKLIELERKATAGRCEFLRLTQDWDGDPSYRIHFPDATFGGNVCMPDIDDARYYNSAPKIGDAEYFAALRNAFPHLLALRPSAAAWTFACCKDCDTTLDCIGNKRCRLAGIARGATSSPAQGETPRTEAEFGWNVGTGPLRDARDFARTLERELTASDSARLKLAKEADLMAAAIAGYQQQVRAAERALAEAREGAKDAERWNRVRAIVESTQGEIIPIHNDEFFRASFVRDLFKDSSA